MKKWIVSGLFVVVLVVLFRQPDIELSDKGRIISYKGLVQPTSYVGVDNDSCTANKLISVEHPYIENTLPAIARAFELGADKIHLNVQVTADNKLAIFHDWTLDCRTDGKGVTSKQSMDYLKTLDLGYGYRIAGSELYPFRGKGLGLMTSLPEVMQHFPEKDFLINMKTKQPRAIKVLVGYLAGLSATERGRLSFIGDQQIMDAVSEQFAEPRLYSQEIAKQCLLGYVLLGWSTYYPESCRHKTIILPEKYGKYLWGWPSQFAARAQANNSQVYLYQTSEPYRVNSDLRTKGIGLFTGDLPGLVKATAD
ncbi:glycerophosphodiester phosphodiesterase family protein [Rheinheimera sp. 1928-s]|uniref:glycerophosphodiester phosphodiesterase family protein n=1 Tax=Rheinheimera sp. 1928-s TaxID=3033803 RepID=UPI0026281FDE|nr:glycerophosphodiester phosphodiesterase family protein [Rheinheimera sp. 1928-s]MDF3126493.1 glycerophosphodiester phosphodiesterase family protein [Rheinheimera sp. 1928-s]